MKNLANEINHLMLDRRMDKAELASRLGMTRQNLSRLLSANKVRQDLMCSTLEKIARVLGVNITHFFDDDVTGIVSRERMPQGRSMQTNPLGGQLNQITAQDLLERKLRLLQQQVEVADELFQELKAKVEIGK